MANSADGELAQDLLEIFGVLNLVGSESARVEFLMEDEGLGSLPAHIPSLGSLLLFNSNINPYKNYAVEDNLDSTGKEKGESKEETNALGEAPKTLVDGDTLPDIVDMDLSYKPVMGEISSLALPTNLPLDFVADIQFSAAMLLLR